MFTERMEYRLYRVMATLCLLTTKQVLGSDPTFTNLDATDTISDSVAIGYEVRTLVATDNETADSSLMYLMTSASLYFQFDPANKKITVMDYLESGIYYLDFIVVDGDDDCATGTLTVIVTNSIPNIINLPSSASVREDAVNETLLHTIDTNDQSPNDTMTCSQTSGYGDFLVKQIDGSTNYGIYLKAVPSSLNYDIVSFYILTIECTDSKTSVSGNFNVSVTENSPPTIQNMPGSTTVSNSTEVGTIVYTITATDTDDTQIYFNMTSDPDPCPFQLYETGEVLTMETITGSFYTLSTYVYDGNSLTGPGEVNISVTADSNSVPVILNLPHTLQVPENTALGTSVYQVNVSDTDSGQNHTYSTVYTPSWANSLFMVDELSGIISTSSTDNIDYENLTVTSVTIAITVYDGLDNATAELTIDIQNSNDHPSFQDDVYYLSGDEGQAGTSFGNPNFVIIDEDVSDSHTYQMNCSKFLMNSTTSEVTLAEVYDLDLAGTASSVTCLATVSDSGFTATTTLSITVNYKNDNTPLCQNSSYNFTVDSSTSVGSAVGSVTAADSDLGTDGLIYYTLEQSSLTSDYFGIDNSGVIFVKSSLDVFATNGTTLYLTAIVSDTGSLSTNASVTAIILPSAVNVTNTTTEATTTTTERYLAFFDDTRNVIWMTCFSSVGALSGMALLVMGHRSGLLQKAFQSMKDTCQSGDKGNFGDDEGLDDDGDSLGNNNEYNDDSGFPDDEGSRSGSASSGSRNDQLTPIGNSKEVGWVPWNESFNF